MARFASAVLALFVIAALASTSSAAPARASTFAFDNSDSCKALRYNARAAEDTALYSLKSIASSEQSTAQAVKAAQAALDNSEAGIKNLNVARTSGARPTREIFMQIWKGWKDAKAALEGLKSSDPKVIKSIQDIDIVIEAGHKIRASCFPVKKVAEMPKA